MPLNGRHRRSGALHGPLGVCEFFGFLGQLFFATTIGVFGFARDLESGLLVGGKMGDGGGLVRFGPGGRSFFGHAIASSAGGLTRARFSMRARDQGCAIQRMSMKLNIIRCLLAVAAAASFSSCADDEPVTTTHVSTTEESRVVAPTTSSSTTTVERY